MPIRPVCPTLRSSPKLTSGVGFFHAPRARRGKKIATALAVALVVIVGCGAPRFDASSDAAVDASLKRLGDSLDAPAKEQLSKDMMALTLPGMMKSAFSNIGKMTGPPSKAELFKPLNGLTVEEIHAAAEKVRAEAPK